MPHWVKIGDADAVPPGKGWSFDTRQGTVAVFNVDGELFAIDDSCPHQGSSLGMGRLQGRIVTCLGHGLKFNVTTGHGATSPLSVRSFQLERRPDGIYVDLQQAAT